MKKLFILLAAVTIAGFMGCSESIVEPTASIPANVPKQLIPLPEKHSISVEGGFIAVKLINGNIGGSLSLLGSLTSVLNFSSSTVVPAGAFDGFAIITESVTNFAGADFYPHMTFKKPLITDFKVTGLDLRNINPEDVEFGYLAPDGSFEPAENEEIIVDVSSGTLAVKKAKIKHFSRWCFVH